MNSKNWNLAITGEMMGCLRFSMHDEPTFLSLIQMFREADIAFTHLEMPLHDQLTPAIKEKDSGSHMGADPGIADDLKWAGFNLVSCAHNHIGDFGKVSIKETIRHLDRVGIVHAGIGPNLERAREPSYLEHKNGRAALISVSSGHDPHEAASATTGIIPGRPGLNPLRFTTHYVVDPDSFQRLKELSARLSRLRVHEPLEPPRNLKLSEDEVYFLGHFVRGEEVTIRTTPNKRDLEANLRAVRDAARQADLVIVSHHHHGPSLDPDRPETFVETFARACIDAGADLYIGHGPHKDQGIEIYQGKPLFYSLGNLFAQSQLLRRIPAEGYENYGLDTNRLPTLTPADFHDARMGTRPPDYPPDAKHPLWWESTVAQITIEKDRLVGFTLYPVTLGYGHPGQERKVGVRVEGRPMLAPPENGQRIIERITRLSLPYGTEIEFIDRVGMVNLANV
jgi:poly-gamma-glutamate synthesis protein (capsule biosynthesis protein)